MRELGKEYRLESRSLSEYFNIDLDNKCCNNPLNYFSIIILLFYIGDKLRYRQIKEILKTHILVKFREVNSENLGKYAELVLLLFDVLTCPFLEVDYKRKVLRIHGVDDNNLQNRIISKRDYWFTKWTNFNFGKELQAKKSQEVY